VGNEENPYRKKTMHMYVEKYIKGLKRFVVENQKYGSQITEFMNLTLDMSTEKQAILIQAFLRGNTSLRTAFREFIKKGRAGFFKYIMITHQYRKRLE